jgi:type I restriction enzyme S subunit
MKTQWQIKKISEIAEYSLGKMLDKAKNRGELKPYLRNFNVRWFDFDLSDMLKMRFLPEDEAKYTAVKGDVLVCEGGYPGRAAIWTQSEPIYFQKALHRVRFHESERNKWFLYYLLAKDLDGTLRNHFRGAGIQHFTGEALAEFEMPMPPLPEQQRIIGILDKAFAAIATTKANTEKNLQNCRALFESHLESIFTTRNPDWIEKKLSDVCAITSALVDPRKREFVDLVHVGAGNILSKNGALVDLKTAREEALISGKFLFGEHMVLYSKIRPYLMKVARPNFSGLCSADMYPLAPLPEQADRDFLFYLLLTKRFTDYAIQGSARAGMPKVNREHLFEFRVWLPSVRIQSELAVRLDALSAETQRLESIYRQKLGGLEALKKSLLHKAFHGQL